MRVECGLHFVESIIHAFNILSKDNKRFSAGGCHGAQFRHGPEIDHASEHQCCYSRHHGACEDNNGETMNALHGCLQLFVFSLGLVVFRRHVSGRICCIKRNLDAFLHRVVLGTHASLPLDPLGLRALKAFWLTS